MKFLLDIQKATSPIQFFMRSEPSFMRSKVPIREYKVITVLAICQKIKKKKQQEMWHFENFNMGVNAEILMVPKNSSKWLTREQNR